MWVFLRKNISYIWITRSYIMSGILLLALSFTRTFALAIVFFAITSFFIGIAGVLTYTFIQKQTPSEMLGRVFAVYGTGTHASIPLGMLISGSILNFMSPHYLIAAIGSCIVLAGGISALNANHIFESALVTHNESC